MNINATLIGQTIAFILFVWFCMKFVWPPIMKALEERKRTIADGLAAGAKGKHERNMAREQLRVAVSTLAVAGAARILEKEIDAKAHAKLLDAVVKEL